jgi:putative FmdB family regulatory protein
MPTYEYRCEKCNQTIEAFQSMKDEAYTVCPKELCRLETWGKGKVKRLLGTGAGLLFKGSGFYATDYRSSGYKEAVKKESGPKEAGASKGEGGKSEGSKGEGGKSEGNKGGVGKSSPSSGGTPTTTS